MTAKAFAILLLIAGTPLRADFVIEQVTESPTGTTKSTMKVKGERARMDMEGPTGKVTALIDKSGRLVTYVHRSKLALVTTMTETQKAGREMLKKAGVDTVKPDPLTNTGETEKIGDWNCEIWIRHTPAVTHKEWRAKDVPNLKRIQEQMAVLSAVPGMGVDAAGRSDTHTVKVERNDAKGTTTTRVMRISEEEVAENDLTPPEGYREMTVPAQ